MSKNKRKAKNRQSRPPAKRPEAAVQPTAAGSDRREHKEEARRRRQRELKKIQRRQTLRKAVVIGASVAAVALVVLFLFRSVTPKAPSSEALKALIAGAPAQAEAAGCGPVKDISAYAGADDHGHIGADVQTAPSLSTYTSVPPVSGPHAQGTVGAGVYSDPIDIYDTIHSLEHGAVAIWYAPSVPQSSIAADASFVKQYQDHTILAPYNYPQEGAAGSLPPGTQFALTSWQKVQTCKSVPGTAVVADFLAKYRWPTLGGGTFQGSTDPKLEKGSPI